MDENTDALKVELTAADMREIQSGFAQIQAQGARLSPSMLAAIDTGAKLGTTSVGGQGMMPLPKQQ